MKKACRVLIVEDDVAMSTMCANILTRAGYQAVAIMDGESALAKLREDPTFQIALVDLKLPKLDGIAVLERIRKSHPATKVIIMTGFATVSSAVKAMKLGAGDYLVKPFEKDEILKAIAQQARLRDLEMKVEQLQTELRSKYCIDSIIGRSQKMLDVLARIEASSSSLANVLLVGESGTGKELIAKAIHHCGKGSGAPFVGVNCAALPASLIESELFGHKRGAFTGARRDTVGLFRAASGGTILLDEVFEIPPEVQAKLLRVIQERTVRPVGGISEVPIDVRIIASTNQDPAGLLASGHLRRDLYYRLSVINIRVPPLRERREDISLLVNHFMKRMSQKYGVSVGPLAPEMIEVLRRYSWPGNVREFENVVEQWFALGPKESVSCDDLPEVMVAEVRGSGGGMAGRGIAGVKPLQVAERILALEALKAAGNNKSRAANLLGISRKKLYRLLADQESIDDDN